MGPEGQRQIEQSARAHVRLIAGLYEQARSPRAEPTQPAMPPPPPETMVYVRMIVQRSLDIDAMLHGYRLGHAALWRCCAREAMARVNDRNLLSTVLDQASDILFIYMNGAMRFVSEEFEVERQAYLRWPVARKMQIVVELLESPTTENLVVLSRTLGYDLTRSHRGIVVQTKDEKLTKPDVLAARIARALDPIAKPLILPVSDRTAWAWLEGSIDLDMIDRAVAHSGTSVGVGEPEAGIWGFRETHKQAVDAIEASLLLGSSVARYRDIALQSVLTGDLDRARRMVRHTLRTLAGDERSESTDRLLMTLEMLLECGYNRRETARRLGVHVHTVVNRIARIEQILGEPITQRAALLSAALYIRAMQLPPAAHEPYRSTTN
jgi:DNA-binding PucR family transcriptional regulator